MKDEKCSKCGSAPYLCVCDWKRMERKYPGDTGVSLPPQTVPEIELVEGNVYFGKLKDGTRFFGECRLRLLNMVQIGGNYCCFKPLTCFGVEEIANLTDFGPRLDLSESEWIDRMRQEERKAKKGAQHEG